MNLKLCPAAQAVNPHNSSAHLKYPSSLFAVVTQITYSSKYRIAFSVPTLENWQMLRFIGASKKSNISPSMQGYCIPTQHSTIRCQPSVHALCAKACTSERVQANKLLCCSAQNPTLPISKWLMLQAAKTPYSSNSKLTTLHMLASGDKLLGGTEGLCVL